MRKLPRGGVLPKANGGTERNDGKCDPLVHFFNGKDAAKQLDPYHISTGFYNIEQCDIGTGAGNYHRVIVLGDHQQTPTGYSTEIAFPYNAGVAHAPFMRCSKSDSWSDWERFYTTNNKPAIADVTGLSDILPTAAEITQLSTKLAGG